MANVFEELRGDAALVAYIDMKSPYAYLAIDPTRDVAKMCQVEIDWRPFTLDIPSYLGSAKLDAKGKVEKQERTGEQWSGVRYSYMDARRYANLTGKTVRGTVKIWDSSLAGIALLWAKQKGPDVFDRFVDAAFPRFWRRELDIEDLAVLAGVLHEVGAETAGFADYAVGPGRDEHDEINRLAFDTGVFGVPTYLVADEMWFGREHLPRVAWLLQARVGRPCDVENRSFGR